MITKTIVAGEDAPRLDSWLAEESGMSRTSIKTLIQAGRVTQNNKPVKASQSVSKGDIYILSVDATKNLIVPETLPLDIVYEDEDLLVVNKARGMVVHPAAGNKKGTLVNALLAYCDQDLSTVQGADRRGIVHRLDKDTSGLIIVAKNNHAHRHLAEQLAKRSMRRIYHAIVWGQMEANSCLIEAPIGRDPRNRKRMAVVADGKPAVTMVDLVEQAKLGAHLRCELKTGRTHQIRVHLSYLGHPVVGDATYGRRKPQIYKGGQLLHAQRLEFIHPGSGSPVELTSDLPPEFDSVMEYMRDEKQTI